MISKQQSTKFFLICITHLTAGLLLSCRSIAPVAPEQKMDNPNKLDVYPQSHISIPIEMSLKSYYGLAEKQVPNEFKGGEHPCEGVSFDYFFKRNPFELSANNNKLQLDVSGKYWIKMSYCIGCSDLLTTKPVCVAPRIPFSCGVYEPMRRMEMQYTTSFDINENYTLTTKTSLTQLKAIDPCEVTVFKYDATDELLKEVKKALKNVASDIDKQLGAINFEKEAQSAWNMLNKPIKIKDFGVLHMNPSEVSISKPKIKNDSLLTTLSLTVLPLFDYSNDGDSAKLPPLKILNEPSSDTFDLNILFRLNYDSLTQTLQHYGGGKQLELKNRIVVFDSLEIAGADNSELIIKVKFSGDKKGVLFLRGTPVYDYATESIELKNVTYDLATKSVLLKTADWLFDQKIIDAIQNASKRNLHADFEKMRKAINDAFHYNFKEYNIEGMVKTIKVVDLATRADEIRMLVSASGKLKLDNFGLKP